MAKAGAVERARRAKSPAQVARAQQAAAEHAIRTRELADKQKREQRRRALVVARKRALVRRAKASAAFASWLAYQGLDETPGTAARFLALAS